MSTPIIIFSVTTLIFYFLSGLLVIVGKKQLPTRLFALFLFQIGEWSLIHILAYVLVDASQLVWLARLSMASVAFMPVTFLAFTRSLFFKKRSASSIEKVYAFLGVVIFILAFTRWSADGFIGSTISYVTIDLGPLYALYILFACIVFGHSFWLLYSIARHEENVISRNQAKLILIGIVLTFFIAVCSNAILPYIFGIRSFNVLGVASTVAFAVTTSYSILRYRLLTVHFLIRRAVVAYSAMILFLSAVLFELLLLNNYVHFSIALLVVLLTVVLSVLVIRKIYAWFYRLFFFGVLDFSKKVQPETPYAVNQDAIKEYVPQWATRIEEETEVTVVGVYVAQPEFALLYPYFSTKRLASMAYTHAFYRYIADDFEGFLKFSTVADRRSRSWMKRCGVDGFIVTRGKQGQVASLTLLSNSTGIGSEKLNAILEEGKKNFKGLLYFYEQVEAAKKEYSESFY